MRLEYEISARDNGQLRALLRGVEKESRASNKRMAADAQQISRQSARGASGQAYGPGRKEQMAQIRANERAAIASARSEVKARIQAERQRARESATSTRADVRQRLTAERDLDRAKQSLDRQRSRALMTRYGAEQREARKVVQARHAAAERIGSGVATSLKGAVGGVLKVGGVAAGLAGGFGAASALEEQSSIQRMASQLANMSGKPGAKGALTREATQVKGFTGSETLGAMGAFVEKTGNLDAARGMIQDMGQLALATGSDFNDLGGAAGQAFNIIRDTIKDPKEQLLALNDVMQGLAAQGNLGAVEIKDMVTELGGLGAATRRFSGGPVQLIKTMGAMAQAAVARGGAGSAGEATTAVTRFSDDIIKDTGHSFEKYGVKRFTDDSHTELRAPEEVMMDVLDKSGGDLEKIHDMFGIFAQRAVGGFAPLYSKAEKNQKGSGRKAVMDEFSKFRDATVSGQDLKDRASSRLADPDLQVKEAGKEFNKAIGQELTPAVIQLAHEATQLVPTLAAMTRVVTKFVGFAAENPWSGIAIMVGGALVKDFLSANIGAAIKNVITTAANNMLGGGSVDSVTGELKPNGKLSAIGAGATIGIGLATFIVTTGIFNIEKRESEMNATGADLQTARAAAAKGDAGTVTEMRQRTETRLNKTNTPGFGASLLGGLLDINESINPVAIAMRAGGGPDLRGKGTDTAQKVEDLTIDTDRQTAVKTMETMIEEMRKLENSVSANTSAVKSNGGPTPNRTAPIVAPAR